MVQVKKPDERDNSLFGLTTRLHIRLRLRSDVYNVIQPKE